MAKKRAQVSYLKQDETVPGGNAPIYLSNLMLKFVDHSKLTSDKEFGIDGTLVDIVLVKSRNNKAGQEVTMVFNQDYGFDPELSLFIMLKQHNKVNGAGAYLFLGERSDMKFSQKQFKEKLRAMPELQAVFMEECFAILETFINPASHIEEEKKEEEQFDIASMMLSKIAC